MTGDQVDLFGGAPREAPRSALADAWARVHRALDDVTNEPCTTPRPATLHAATRRLARLVVNWPELAQLSAERTFSIRNAVSRVAIRRATPRAT
jgi:hypothetical protein